MLKHSWTLGAGDGVQADFARIDKDGDGQLNYNEVAFDIADVNKDSQLSLGEYHDARAAGNLSNTAGISCWFLSLLLAPQWISIIKICIIGILLEKDILKTINQFVSYLSNAVLFF